MYSYIFLFLNNFWAFLQVLLCTPKAQPLPYSVSTLQQIHLENQVSSSYCAGDMVTQKPQTHSEKSTLLQIVHRP